MVKSFAVLAGALVVLLAPAPAGAKMPDPGLPGPFKVTRILYSAGSVQIKYGDASVGLAQRLRGNLHMPATGRGPFPVIVFQHGFHSSCQMGETDGDTSFPCKEGDTGSATTAREERSYAGFDYIARTLASHGYVVMSVDTNNVNDWTGGPSDGGDHARAILIGESLDLLAAWNAGSGPSPVDGTLTGRLAMSRIGLMGHSRGGEAVASYVAYDRVRTDGPRHGVDAVVSIAPTDFNRPNPAGVAFATVLPYCDGDVSDLRGALTWERTKAENSQAGFPHIQWSVNSANHNFFNTEWESDDAATNPFETQCGVTLSPTRLSSTEQQSVGRALTVGFLRRYVGGENAFERLMTGAELPASLCPDPIPAGPSCANVVMGSYVAPAPRRTLLIEPGATEPTTTGADGTLAADGFLVAGTCTPLMNGGTGCATSPNRSTARQLTLAWNRPATLRADVPAAKADVSRHGALHLRAATNFDDPLNTDGAEQDFVVRLTDTAGATAAVPVATMSVALEPSLGTTSREVVLNGIRIPLTSFRGVRLTSLRSVTLEFGERSTTGSIQIADVAFQN